MAGPTASIIVKKPLNDLQRAKLLDMIESRAGTIEGNDFWIDGRPFLWKTGEEYPGELSEEDLTDLIGWQPKDQVVIAAMCNSDQDHRLLAELCIEVDAMLFEYPPMASIR